MRHAVRRRDAPRPSRSAPRRASSSETRVEARPARVRSVADIDLSGDAFEFRRGTDPRFTRAGGRAPRRSVTAEDDSDEGEAEREARPERAERPTRGTAEARAELTRPLPVPEMEFRQARRREAMNAARRASAPADGDGAGDEDYDDDGEEEDMRDFQPRTLTRAASSDPASATQRFFAGVSWEELGASAPLAGALGAAGAARPSAVQAAAWRALEPGGTGQHVLIADAAGSGKTLAYLAPLVAALRAREEAGLPRAAARSPLAVVLAPTAELAAQVQGVARRVSAGGAPFRTAAATGGHSQRTQADALAGGTDVLVGTPGRVAALLRAGQLSLADARWLVLDEADVLAGPHGDFEEDVGALRAALPSGARVLLVTASLAADAAAHLQKTLLGGKPPAPALGPGLHRPSAGCEERLVDCGGPAVGGGELSWRQGFRRKAEALARALADAPRDPTLVFCNTLDGCRAVENFLKRRDRRGSRYTVHVAHAAVDAPQRNAALAALATLPAPGSPPPVVVATDRASRGLDCAGVRHVVLFDFPRDAAEYVRRVGRTARGAGGTGRATLLVLGRQLPLAREIMARNARGDPLEPIPLEAEKAKAAQRNAAADDDRAALAGLV